MEQTQTTTAYDRYMAARRTESEAEVERLFPLGPEVPWTDTNTVQLVIDRYVIERATGEKTGFIRVDRGRPVQVIFDALHKGLGDMIDEYFSLSDRYENPGGLWPTSWRWIACFPVTGGSEGHYVHVEVIGQDGSRRLMFLAKTFQGMDHAWKIAQRLGELLGV